MVAIESEQMALPSHLSVVNPRNHLPRQLRLNVVGASKAKLTAQGLTEGAFTLVFSIEVRTKIHTMYTYIFLDHTF